MEPEVEKLMQDAFAKNFIDYEEVRLARNRTFYTY
jgi:hypothetical protein